MAQELAFVLINPYTIGKSRTGGVISRIISQTGLELVAARMFAPSRQLVEEYAALVKEDEQVEGRDVHILSDYILRGYMPDQATGECKRVLMLLFEGEDAIRKVREMAGNVRYNMDSARTVRDIYGDYVVDANGKVMYVEPAILIGPNRDSVAKALRLWAKYSETDGGIVDRASDVEKDQAVQKTLVLIKPDNFRFPSSRPGNIIDLFSGSGLRIVGAKVHRMSVAEAEEFYGPVREVLRVKLKNTVADRAARALTNEFSFEMPGDVQVKLGEMLGPVYGDNQFYEIVRFMTGYWPTDCSAQQKTLPGKERCLALVYAGIDAVNIIRRILGPTDPSKAQPGSVRREFGRDVMVNAAHASDSAENAQREMGIIRVDKDMIKPLLDKYYGI